MTCNVAYKLSKAECVVDGRDDACDFISALCECDEALKLLWLKRLAVDMHGRKACPCLTMSEFEWCWTAGGPNIKKKSKKKMLYQIVAFGIS